VDSENSAGPFEFAPSLSFDDLQQSIVTTNEPQLSEFPAPGGGGGIISGRGILGGMKNNQEAERKISVTASVNSGNVISGARPGRSGSILRRPSLSSRQSSQTSSMDPPTAPLAMRTRRESNVSSVASNGGAPRKSIGPGVLGTDFVERARQRQRPSLGGNAGPPIIHGGDATGVTTLLNANGTLANSSESSKHLSTSRSLKAKSLQPPPRQAQGHLAAPSMTPEHARPSSMTNSKPSGKSPARRTNTPSSSSSKRISTMPIHATGLGARTISPTDARRLKRMSTMQYPPPVPTTPPTPQPELLAGTRPAAQSPSMIPRKSVTPSSSRTTPDQNRKSYSSGLSVSSNTSFNSIRTSTGSLQPRLSQNLSACRLPTPKPRNIHSSAATEEEVPPVPAIPKAYESPKEQIEHPLFANRKSSLPLDTSSAASSSTAELFPTSTLQEPFRSDGEDRRRRVRIGDGSEGEPKPTITSGVSKKNLQPLRLPPLNLLPLSKPTVAKVKALQEPSSDAEGGSSTPPPKRNQRATPSTPMTASKTSFFKSRRDDDSTHTALHMRSTSSTQLAGPETSLHREGSDSSSGGPTAASGRLRQQAHSPFISTSLPKSSNDFGQLRSKNSGEYVTTNTSIEPRNTRLNGPRAQTSVKLVMNETPTQSSSPAEPDTPSSASSLRRKLSLSWRRSSSKTSHAATERGAEYLPQAQKHDNMPPPKLPASATWSGSVVPSPSPSIKSTSQLEAGRRKSSISNFASGHDRTKSDSWDTNASAPSPKKDIITHELSSTRTPVTRSGSSILSPMHKILSSKTSFGSLKSRNADADLDADDFSAEEEMRKLASRRKDFELAAAEVDDLRKRAVPKERFSPTQALRMTNLNIFERGEIIDYKEIYFCGTQDARKHVGDLNAQAANFGYDDDRGDYTIVNGDHLAYRYEIIDILGKGSFGQVVRCVDHKSGGLVAVKIIRNKKRFHQQALVEVNILQKLREWVSRRILH
jgi:dual specificity tyrosine-phosphorylation-regulated kinase 2/3/4